MLAVRILEQQHFEIEALNVRTIFEYCHTRAACAADGLGVRLTVLSVGDDYLDVIRHPTHGYGRAVNPCVDCRAYMGRMAKQFMEQVGACVVITGEVLGQRPMSQRRWQLDAIEQQSGLEGRLLRPLSGKLLPPTIPERGGLVDREKLYDFNGRGRRKLIALARELGIQEPPQPSTGCALTEVTFAPRVRDLLKSGPSATRWDFELLNVGRHIRLDEETKVVVGRNREENALMEAFFHRADASEAAMLYPKSFVGPNVLVVGRLGDEAVQYAGALTLRFTRQLDSEDALVCVVRGGSERVVRVGRSDSAESASLL